MLDAAPVRRSVLKHGATTDKIIRGFYDVYNELGHGFLESVYERSLAIALEELGCVVHCQSRIPVFFRQRPVGEYYADMLVNGVVIVELKTVSALERCHYIQLAHYLKATQIEVGVLLNFGPQPAFKRVVLDNGRKAIRANPRESVFEDV